MPVRGRGLHAPASARRRRQAFSARHGVPPKLAARLEGGPLSASAGAALWSFRLAARRRAAASAAGRPLRRRQEPDLRQARRPRGAPRRRRRRAPLVVTADGQRAGATEQLAAFTRVLNAPLVPAPDAAALAAAVARRGERPARADRHRRAATPSTPRRPRRCSRWPGRAAPTSSPCCRPGSTRQESADLARAFAVLGARHLLPTRLDAARRLGGVRRPRRPPAWR